MPTDTTYHLHAELLMDALTRRCRIINAELTARLIDDGDYSAQIVERKLLRRLARNGHLVAWTVRTHPLLDLQGPVYSWHPGDPVPPDRHWGQLAYQVQNRWTKKEQPSTVFFASEHAAAIYGGVGTNTITQRFQATHDLHVTAVYLQYRRLVPTMANDWIGEHILRCSRLSPINPQDGVPDALICRNWAIVHGADFVGAYGPERLNRHFCWFYERRIPVEFW